MSRTNKGSKGWRFEYWSRRYDKHESYGRYPGREAKKLTHRYERREGKISTEEIAANIGEEYIGYYGDKTGRWLYDGDGVYPFFCSNPNSETWQGDLRNG